MYIILIKRSPHKPIIGTVTITTKVISHPVTKANTKPETSVDNVEIIVEIF